MPPHTLPHPSYRPDIDGLRAAAVLSVLLFHAFPDALKGGFVGVDVFFVISTYLIGTIILSGSRDGSFSFRKFYMEQAGPYNLTAVDYGHLSPDGSRMLAQTLLRPKLAELLRDAP